MTHNSYRGAHSYAEVESIVRGLGVPEKGRVRVFRGQNKAYPDNLTGAPSLVPNLLRPGAKPDYDVAWLRTLNILVRETSILPPTVADAESGYDLWIPALIQHYGPGSLFIDVTRNLEVALWFGLHKRQERWVSGLVSGPSLNGLERSMLTAWFTDMSVYDRAEKPGVIYVFDLLPWDESISMEHGEFVDLLSTQHGKRLADFATRLTAQAAGLVFADPEGLDGQNLAGFLRAEIHLSADFLRSSPPSIRRPTGTLFPSPEQDPFYKIILGIPDHVRFSPSRLEHPLGVPCYLAATPPLWETPSVKVAVGEGKRSDPVRAVFGDDVVTGSAGGRELSGFASCGGCLDPPLFHAYLLSAYPEAAQPSGGIRIDDSVFRFGEAVPYLLETPLLVMTPGVTNESALHAWDQVALSGGITDELAGRPTNNVYLEWSPLDVMPIRDYFHYLPRGVWIVHSGGEYAVTLYRWVGGKSYRATQRFRFDAKGKRFIWLDPRGRADMALPEAAWLGPMWWFPLKALFVGLALLRDLSPGLKRSSLFPVVRFPDQWDGEEADIPLETDIPQCAIALPVESTPYLIPKAIDGTLYKPAGQFGVVVIRKRNSPLAGPPR